MSPSVSHCFIGRVCLPEKWIPDWGLGRFFPKGPWVFFGGIEVLKDVWGGHTTRRQEPKSMMSVDSRCCAVGAEEAKWLCHIIPALP